MKISPINNYQYINKVQQTNSKSINQQKQSTDTFVHIPYHKSSIKQVRSNLNFGIIKPEHMFINTKGFSKDTDWAYNVISIINSGKTLVQKNTKFEDLIEFIAAKYNSYYMSLDFNPLYGGNSYFGTKRFTVTGNRLCDKYEPYRERAKELVEKNTTHDSYKMCAYLPSQNKVVELTEIKVTKMPDGSFSTYAEAPNINKIEPVMNEVAHIYKGLKDEKDIDKITNSVAQIHWLVSQVRPYTRGSAGIADMLSKMIFEAKGIQVSAYKKDVNPNLEAFVMPLDEYCEKYTSFFSEPLRKISEEAIK